MAHLFFCLSYVESWRRRGGEARGRVGRGGRKVRGEKRKNKDERWEVRSDSCCLTGGFLGRAEMISEARSVTLAHPAPHKAWGPHRAHNAGETRAHAHTEQEASCWPTRLPLRSRYICALLFKVWRQKQPQRTQMAFLPSQPPCIFLPHSDFTFQACICRKQSTTVRTSVSLSEN